MANANKHERNFDKGSADLDIASKALDEGRYIKSTFYAGRG